MNEFIRLTEKNTITHAGMITACAYRCPE